MSLRNIDAANAAKGIEAGKLRLYDIREPHEHARERIDGAVTLPLSDIMSGTAKVEPGATPVFHCKSGIRTAMNAAALADIAGGPALILEGGIMAWKRAGLPVTAQGGPSLLARLAALFGGTKG